MNSPFLSRRWLLVSSFFALGLILALAYRSSVVLDGLDVIGHAVCHQIPERSFHIFGRPMPLCARCTGTFLGSMLGFTWLIARRRTRCDNVPPIPILALFVIFFAMWGGDGLNSYLTLFEDAPHLYEPHNTLRLITGMLLGISLSNLVYPVASMTFWTAPAQQRSVDSLFELAVLLGAGATLILIILSGWPPALYALSVVSTLGVIAMLLTVTTLIVVIFMRRENKAVRWRDLVVPAAGGLTLTGLLIAFMNLIRIYLTSTFGLPF